MASPPQLIDQVAAFHADAFAWAVTCSGGDPETAADTLQECYVKLANGRATFAGRSSLKTWWLAVIRFTTLEQRRRHQLWLKTADTFRDWIAGLSERSAESSSSDLPSHLSADQLAAALTRLPHRQAEVLHLVFQHDLSLSESAVVMGVSVGSARQHYDRAKKRLRKELAHPRLPPSDHAT